MNISFVGFYNARAHWSKAGGCGGPGIAGLAATVERCSPARLHLRWWGLGIWELE